MSILLRRRLLPSAGLALILTSACSGAHSAWAKTWRVSQDGSGDFQSLITAVSSLASGDTLSIGAGVYDSTVVFTGVVGDRPTCLPVSVAELTVVGDSADSVHVGPLVPDHTGPTAPTVFYGGTDCQMLNVSGVTLRNADVGINSSSGGSVRDVIFQTNRIGLVDNGGVGMAVDDCFFDRNTAGYIANGVFSLSPTVRSSRFVGGVSVSARFVAGVRGGAVVDCDFPSGRVGIQFEQGATDGVVNNCRFGTFEGACIVVTSLSSAQVSNSVLKGSSLGATIEVDVYSSLLVTLSRIGPGAGGASIVTASPVALEVRQCDLNPGTGVVLRLLNPGLEASTINMPLNWWGTTDSAAIEDLIIDATDIPEVLGTVVYEPFASGPVPVESVGMGGFKAMFRGH